MWRDIIAEDLRVSVDSAWNSIHIYINRPHLVNRRLSGTEKLLQSSCLSFPKHVTDIYNLDRFSDELMQFLTLKDVFDSRVDQSDWNITIRTLIPRSTHYQEIFEAVIEDIVTCQVVFFSSNNGLWLRNQGDIYSPSKSEVVEELHDRRSPSANCIYRISCIGSAEEGIESVCLKMSVWECDSKDAICILKSVNWLRDILFPKLVSWAKKSPSSDGRSNIENTSLRLIPTRTYANLYQRLKAKYFADIVANWTESTDPKKFVSEDIGIAAYLMALWELEREATGCGLQSFVDLGCGNGLLVHILRQEGHIGIGLDVRSRKTWKQFDSTSLIERIFDPATEILPEFDWIIGNHSDELTPWIPWVAARSSYKTRFFLLPCCAFDFNRKFNKPGNESEYQSYFKYVRLICKEVGFDVEEDILRIPSTKRNCFIGRSRNYLIEEELSMESRRHSFLKSRLDSSKSSFVVRSAAETTKNCTGFSQSTKDKVIKEIVTKLLESEHCITLPSGKVWNGGKKMNLTDLAAVLEPDTLNLLKNQCGGLQTFIRNHKFIFDTDHGEVKLRNFTEYREPKKNSKAAINYKQKACWFFLHHPDGCVLETALCHYKHSF